MKNIKRCMKKAKENWIGEQSEGIPTGERLDHCETGESNYCPRSFRKMPHKRVTEYCSELYNYKANGD